MIWTNDQGALVAKVHYDKVMSYLKIAEEEGGTFVTGGGRPEGVDKGYFVQPTIITGLDDNSRLVREEIFGPVVVCSSIRYRRRSDCSSKRYSYGIK